MGQIQRTFICSMCHPSMNHPLLPKCQVSPNACPSYLNRHPLTKFNLWNKKTFIWEYSINFENITVVHWYDLKHYLLVTLRVVLFSSSQPEVPKKKGQFISPLTKPHLCFGAKLSFQQQHPESWRWCIFCSSQICLVLHPDTFWSSS